MSYCRWSSMNWMCDVYCYEDAGGGWTTHVAGSKRLREPMPGELDILTVSPEAWFEAHTKTMDDLKTIELAPIGLAYDGKTFNDPTLEEFRDRLLMLREAKYNIPDHVFGDIENEITE